MTVAGLAEKRVLVVTVSDRCAAGTQEDLSGPGVASVVLEAGATLEILVVADEIEAITALLRVASASKDLILTTGGTGLAERDVTPEATLAVCERLVPGLAELIRREGHHETPFAALGRGVAGVRGKCLIVNLPGSPRGAVSAVKAVLGLLPHALSLLAGKTDHESSPA